MEVPGSPRSIRRHAVVLLVAGSLAVAFSVIGYCLAQEAGRSLLGAKDLRRQAIVLHSLAAEGELMIEGYRGGVATPSLIVSFGASAAKTAEDAGEALQAPAEAELEGRRAELLGASAKLRAWFDVLRQHPELARWDASMAEEFRTLRERLAVLKEARG